MVQLSKEDIAFGEKLLTPLRYLKNSHVKILLPQMAEDSQQ